MAFNTIFKSQAELILDVLGLFDWNKCFALKGGTAINYFYENLPRLSVDIDLVYTPINSRAEALEDMGEVLESFIKKCSKMGLKTMVIGQSVSNPLGILNISNLISTIKVEPNIILRGLLLPTQNRKLCSEIKKLFNVDLEVICTNYKEVITSKLVALMDRQHPRDIFDVSNYFRNEKYEDLESLIDLFIIYLCQSNRPFSELLNPNRLDLKNVFKSTFQGMTKSEVRIDFLNSEREKIITSLQNLIKEKQIEFLISFMELNPNWSLLSFNAEKMPGILWKLVNIERMSIFKRKKEIDKLKSFFK